MAWPMGSFENVPPWLFHLCVCVFKCVFECVFECVCVVYVRILVGCVRLSVIAGKFPVNTLPYQTRI